MASWQPMLLLAVVVAGGCTPTTELGASDRGVVPRARVGTTQGSALAITQDERIAVVANRTDGVISIVQLAPGQATSELISDEPRTHIPLHPVNESKPWAVAIAPDDDTAYVLVRGLHKVVRISGLHGPAPGITAEVEVGSEPTSLAISPSGRTLYVANSGDGSVSSIVTASLHEASWDLNWRLAVLADLGFSKAELGLSDDGKIEGLGSLRPGLAHPRALALTDDGDEDDDDEILYATEFFSQPTAAASNPDPDRDRQGIVYPIKLGTGAGNPVLDSEGKPLLGIALSAVETGFDDAEGNATGCFPNQLFGAAVQGTRLFVTSVCASPAGPVESGLADERANNNFKTLSQPVIFVVDTRSNRQSAAIVLTKELDRVYSADEPDARMPLIPQEIVFSAPGGGDDVTGYVSAFGASAVFPVRFDADNAVEIGSTDRRFIGLGRSALPVGFAALSKGRALVVDDGKPSLKALDLTTSSLEKSQLILPEDWATTLPPEEVVSASVREGRRLFATGLGAWSFEGRGWSSCESCHPEGLSDGVVWRFSRGPRRTLSLAGTYYGGEPTRRALLWTANIDEVHDVEGIARGLSGGVGGVVWNPYAQTPHKNCRLVYDGKFPTTIPPSDECSAPEATALRHSGLVGGLTSLPVAGSAMSPCKTPEGDAPTVCDINGAADWDNIDAFVRSVRAPRAPSKLNQKLVSDGRDLFGLHRCTACHAGDGWTLSSVFYAPGARANGALPFEPPATPPEPDVLQSLLGELRSRTFVVPEAAPAAFGAPGSSVPFLPAPPAGASAQDIVNFLYGEKYGPDEQKPPADRLNCVLRDVGTFPKAQAELEAMQGVVPPGAPEVSESRHIIRSGGTAYADVLALGDSGFNIPSLLGLAGGGPYFHAGNARTLEEVFDPTFAGHHGALDPSFQPSAGEREALVYYLLSIDESGDARPLAPATEGELGYDPDLCAQF